jgi:hypothetical protein
MVRVTTVAALLVAAALIGAPQARAELMEWDQAKVTALAGELAEKTKDLRDAVRRQPAPTLGQVGRRAHHQLRDELWTIESTSRRLRDALSEGATMEETLPTYRRLITSVRNAARELRRMQLGEPAAGRVEAAADVLRRLRPYYEEAPPV